MSKRYTVIGLYVDETPYVAGVVKGRVLMLDAGAPGDRFADDVKADSADHAEEIVLAERSET